MFRQSAIKPSSKSLLTNPSLQNKVVDLDPPHEESLSGGSQIVIWVPIDPRPLRKKPPAN